MFQKDFFRRGGGGDEKDISKIVKTRAKEERMSNEIISLCNAKFMQNVE